MQETQNLTNSQKLEQLKAGCRFKVRRKYNPYHNAFATQGKGSYLAVYQVAESGAKTFEGEVEDTSTEEQLVISYVKFCKTRFIILKLDSIEIL